MEIFDEFIVVDEKLLTDIDATPTATYFYCRKCNERTNFSTKLRDVTQFAAFEFKIDNHSKMLEIKYHEGIGNAFDESENVPLAQFVRWAWDGKVEQVISETKILKIGGQLDFYINFGSSFVVRILKKKETTDQNPCLTLSSPDDDLTVQIGEEEITVSAHWFMSVSPVIQRMLSVEMREKQQRMITLDELGVDMEQFKEFLGFILPVTLHNPIFPTPKNVLLLLKLADYFQIDWLKLRCDFHLINCVEIPLIDRFLLIEKYRLINLKNYFLRLDANKLGAFFKANREQVMTSVPVFSKQFLVDLILCLSK